MANKLARSLRFKIRTELQSLKELSKLKKSEFRRPYQDLQNVCPVANGSTVPKEDIAGTPCASLSQSALIFVFCLQQVFYWGGGKQTPHKVDMFQGGHSALQVNIRCFILNNEQTLFSYAQGSNC